MVWVAIGLGLAALVTIVVWTLCRVAHAIDEVLDVLERFPRTKGGDDR